MSEIDFGSTIIMWRNSVENIRLCGFHVAE
jgi:hypothetical protein